MGRLPWSNAPAYRGGHDEGGVEHLETDVMRFMAILAFCLVAIFALVQSMPLDSATPADPSSPAPAAQPQSAPEMPPPAASARTQAPEPTPLPPEAPVETPASPVSAPAPEPVTLVLPVRPAPRAASTSRLAAVPAPAPPAAPAPATEPTATQTSKPGFTLRFESDDALRALVAKNEVALYALSSGNAWRAVWVETRLSFRPAQVPSRIHEMTPQTVPRQAVQTLRRRVAVEPGDVNWGVTLPAATSRELNALLASASGGDLVIDADARLRLEPGS